MNFVIGWRDNKHHHKNLRKNKNTNMIFRILSVVVALTSVTIGVFTTTTIPSNLGFYRWLATVDPGFIGLTRSFVEEGSWGFTVEDLYDEPKLRLKGQTAIVTGANSGVGYEKSLALGRLGASVTLACRNVEKCNKAAQSIRDDPRYGGGEITTMTVDTSSLKSVQQFSRDYIRKAGDGAALDMLFLNAGIGAASPNEDGSPALSEDGIEIVFATNFVGHHLMYRLLEPLILRSKTARVVQTSSASSFDTFMPYKVATSLEQLNGDSGENMKRYGQSKLAQVLWVKELTSRLASSEMGGNNNVYANAYHPGMVDTAIFGKHPLIPEFIKESLVKWMRREVMWRGEEGALTGLYLGIEVDDLVNKNIKGKYFHPQTKEVVNDLALDEPLQKQLWSFADDLVSDFL